MQVHLAGSQPLEMLGLHVLPRFRLESTAPIAPNHHTMTMGKMDSTSSGVRQEERSKAH